MKPGLERRIPVVKNCGRRKGQNQAKDDSQMILVEKMAEIAESQKIVDEKIAEIVELHKVLLEINIDHATINGKHNEKNI